MGLKARSGINQDLLEHLRLDIGPRADVVEKRMFGGVAFLVDGKMSCGVTGDDLMLRLSHAQAEEALAAPHTRPMDFTGRPMRGFVYLGKSGWVQDAVRAPLVALSVEYAKTLPARKR
jgi:hypothetical protein